MTSEPECGNCGETITKEKQRVGSQISSDEDKPDGGIYTTKCSNCGEKNHDKVSNVLSG